LRIENRESRIENREWREERQGREGRGIADFGLEWSDGVMERWSDGVSVKLRGGHAPFKGLKS